MAPPPPAPARRRAARRARAACALAALAAIACSDDGARDAAAGGVAARPTVAEESCRLGPAQVTGRGADVVRLGMPADELRRRCLAEDTALSLGEGQQERALAVHVDSARAVALLDPAGLVERVIVPVRGPTTPGGVGVGSTLASVQARHGRLCGLLGEGRVVVLAAGLPGVSFVTSADFGRFAADTALLRDRAFLRATRVTELLVHGQPSSCAEP